MLFSFSNSKLSRITIYIVFLTSLASLLGIIVIVASENLTIPRQQTTIAIDVNNKLNICKPESDNFEISYE